MSDPTEPQNQTLSSSDFSDSINLEYEITPDDLYAYYISAQKIQQKSFTKQRVIQGVIFIPLMLAMFVFMAWNSIQTIIHYGIVAIGRPDVYMSLLPLPGLIAFSLIAWFITCTVYRYNARRELKDEDEPDKGRKFHADFNGFEFGGRQIYGKYRWPELIKINEDLRGFIFICSSYIYSTAFAATSGPKIIIPKRLFGSLIEARDLLRRINLLRNSKLLKIVPIGPGLITPENQIGFLPFETEASYSNVLFWCRWRERKNRVQTVFRFGLIALVYIIVVLNGAVHLVGSTPFFIIYPLIFRGGLSLLRKRQNSPDSLTAQNRLRKMYILPNSTGPKLFAFGPSHFVISTVNGSTRYAWDIVDIIAEYKGNVIIDFKKGRGVVLPPSTFHSDVEREALIDKLRRAWRGETEQIETFTGHSNVWPPPPNWLGV